MRMLLGEFTESEIARYSGLVGIDYEIAQKAVLYLRLCAITIADKVLMLQELPSDLPKQLTFVP